MSRWPDLYDFEVDSTPLPQSEVFPRGEAKRRAWRAFWRGVVIGGLMTGAAFIGGAAWGETTHIGRMFINGEPVVPSSVTISPSDEPGQLAVVTFVNRHVNQEEDNGLREIATADVGVSVRFIFDFNPVTGADRIEVQPPRGVTCAPEDCGVTVMEGFTGQVVLFQWQGS